MKSPTEAQLNDPKWWSDRFEGWVTAIAIEQDSRGSLVAIHPRQTLHGSVVTISHRDNEITLRDRPPKPTAPEPNRSAPEWSDWKISPGSWPYHLLERMNAETGRMSYDNPVKGMIRDLWSQVARPSRQDKQDQLQRERYAEERRQREEVIETALSLDTYPMGRSAGGLMSRHDFCAKLYDAGLLHKAAQ